MGSNKKGQAPTMMIVVFVFFAAFMVIGFGVLYYATQQADGIIGGISGLVIGDLTFAQTYQDTLGQGMTAFLNTLSGMALALVLGMIIVMLIIGFKLDSSRLWILLDLLVIVGAFIAAVYLSETFETFINSSADILAVFSNDFQLPSNFILNLPAIVIIVGALIMIVTYTTNKRKSPNAFTAR